MRDGRRLLLLVVGCCTLVAYPSHGSAQVADEGVRGTARVTLGTTTVRGKASGFWGMSAGLRFGNYGLQGGGYVVGDAAFIDDGGSSLRVSAGYGGLEFDAPLPWIPLKDGRLAVLFGAGNAEVRDPIVGRELGADNFVVVEPRIVWVRPFAGFAAGEAALGYRVALGVDDLPGVGGLQMSGPTVSVSVSVLKRGPR